MMSQGDISLVSYESTPAMELNVAAWCDCTTSLGPGSRSVLWVQGCPFKCPECIAPDWIPETPATLISPEAAALLLTKNPNVTGITLSGGEPMLQAEALAKMLLLAKQIRTLNVICFTGFKLQHLKSQSESQGVRLLLECIDVLIDGQYVAGLNNEVGLRGSTNQQIHFLSDVLIDRKSELLMGQRSLELQLKNGEALMVGIPDRRKLIAINETLRQRSDLIVAEGIKQ
jgi:anaerobic ribonucleoside-triphosphate reductase activating protein